MLVSLRDFFYLCLRSHWSFLSPLPLVIGNCDLVIILPPLPLDIGYCFLVINICWSFLSPLPLVIGHCVLVIFYSCVIITILWQKK